MSVLISIPLRIFYFSGKLYSIRTQNTFIHTRTLKNVPEKYQIESPLNKNSVSITLRNSSDNTSCKKTEDDDDLKMKLQQFWNKTSTVLLKFFEEVKHSNELKLVQMATIKTFVWSKEKYNTHIVNNPDVQALWENVKRKGFEVRDQAIEKIKNKDNNKKKD